MWSEAGDAGLCRGPDSAQAAHVMEDLSLAFAGDPGAREEELHCTEASTGGGAKKRNEQKPRINIRRREICEGVG